ncbi:unnamed protein product [Mycena citricolor]|uniref:F-box domain-containing protein n=1 Tax=Mycena citricolor TaxID=2018698 RepID=A0AAD2JY45_9AGAR|nr:unnamed protein product [Mycena citricolor]
MELDYGAYNLPLTPIPELLPSTAGPPSSENEAQLIVAAIADAQKKLNDLEAHITALQHQGAKLRHFISQHNSILAPIRRVPNEILTEVFRVCVDQDARRERRRVPWTITWVCARWRAVALNAPHLWRSVSIFVGGYDHAAPGPGKLETQLARAGAVPLSVHVHSNVEIGELYPFEPIYETCRRWELASITGESITGSILNRVFAPPSNSFSLLRSLRIQTTSWMVTAPTRASFPALRSVDFAMRKQLFPRHFIVPWHQLEMGRFEQMDLIDVLWICSQVSPIFLLHLDNSKLTWKRLGLPDQVTCAAGRIKLTNYRRLFFSELLGRLRAPDLTEMSLEYIHAHAGQGREFAQILVDFFAVSGCALRKLCIDGPLKELYLVRILTSPSAETVVDLDCPLCSVSDRAVGQIRNLLPHLVRFRYNAVPS